MSIDENNGFVEGNHPDAYDARGNFRGNLPDEEIGRTAVVSPVPVKAQPGFNSEHTDGVLPGVSTLLTQPVSEEGGFKAPGGNTREAIRARMNAVKPYTSVPVRVDEWDADFEVRSLSLGDRNDMMATLLGDGSGAPDTRKMFPTIIIACTYDVNGEKVFTPEDEAWLNSLPANLVDKIALPAMKLSGMGQDNAVDAAAKKSSSTEDAE